MMEPNSDIVVNAAAFDPEKASEGLLAMKVAVAKLDEIAPRWYRVGAANYRDMFEKGKTPWPAPTYLAGAVDSGIPSRDSGREIPTRVYEPENGQPSKGTLLHFHAGGWAVGSHRHYDDELRTYANGSQLTVISVGYRLAPEHPHPASVHDSIDAAQYLVDHGPARYGAPFVGLVGASAGAHLAAVAALDLMRTRPSHRLAAGLLLWYGQYDLSGSRLPSGVANDGGSPGVIDWETIEAFHAAFIPGLSAAARRHPLVSPIYEDFRGLARGSPSRSLPPALFFCGADDVLLDDTVLMATRWRSTGSTADVKIYPAAPHGFNLVPGLRETEESFALAVAFLNRQLEISEKAGE